MHRDLWTDDIRFTFGHHTLQSTFNQVTSDENKKELESQPKVEIMHMEEASNL